MADPKTIDVVVEDDYDEEADSDFDAGDNKEDFVSSSSEDEAAGEATTDARPHKRRKTAKVARKDEGLGELDSGDEATIREREKKKRKQKRKGQDEGDESGGEEQGWRAKTRAMREKDKDEKKKNKLASTKGSTIDVEKLWKEMNDPGVPDLQPTSAAIDTQPASNGHSANQIIDNGLSQAAPARTVTHGRQENIEPKVPPDDMITIKRTYEFAGEVHTETKKVLKSSAEGRLWLSQQSSRGQSGENPTARPLRRPLRKLSRFDPNLTNLASIKKSWEKQFNDDGTEKGPKLNTVEKSKMDWAAHVDQEGLKDELDEHAKAKEGYLGRMDFLGQVEQRREEEARTARLKG